MEVFELKAGRLKIKDANILLIPEFQVLWDSDSSKEKIKVFEMFKFLYLYCDYKSPFNDFNDTKRKEESLLRTTLSSKDLETPNMKAAAKIYIAIENTNPVIKAIGGAKKLLDKMQDYIEEVDFTEKIDGGAQKGKLVHSIAEARKTIIEMPLIVEKLRELRKAYEEETKEVVDYRKNTKPSVWSDIEG